MNRSDTDFAPNDGKRITLCEGWNLDPLVSDEGYFQGQSMLIDRIVDALQQRGYTDEEIDGFWVYGYNGASDKDTALAAGVVDHLHITPMHELKFRDDVGDWTAIQAAWDGYDYNTKDEVFPVVAICRPEAFTSLENDLYYRAEEGYRSGEGVVLEVELQTMFNQE